MVAALPGPSLDGNPVLWREWHRSKPSRLLRVVWILYTALGILWIVVALKVRRLAAGNQEVIAIMSMFQVSLGLLLLSVSAATSLAEERVRGSLDVLLCTPLSTRSILVGKWWGSFRQAGRVLIWPVILAGILVAQSGHLISLCSLAGADRGELRGHHEPGTGHGNLGQPDRGVRSRSVSRLTLSFRSAGWCWFFC